MVCVRRRVEGRTEGREEWLRVKSGEEGREGGGERI